MENDILKHRKAVQENILKSFGAEVSEDMLEKAHNHGDVHSNGKWYWESSANGGKGDWRTIKKDKKNSESQESGDSKEKNENSLDSYASETSTDTLKKVISSDKADKKLKEAAKKELEKRGNDDKEKSKVEEKDINNKKDSEVKKINGKSSYESEKADAYDKGDGKVGNYSVPTHTSYPAANLYSRLNNNRHFGFKHGLPVKEIMEKLKDYKGNVNVSYHNNAGTSEIYRIKFL